MNVSPINFCGSVRNTECIAQTKNFRQKDYEPESKQELNFSYSISDPRIQKIMRKDYPGYSHEPGVPMSQRIIGKTTDEPGYSYGITEEQAYRDACEKLRAIEFDTHPKEVLLQHLASYHPGNLAIVGYSNKGCDADPYTQEDLVDDYARIMAYNRKEVKEAAERKRLIEQCDRELINKGQHYVSGTEYYLY